MLAGGVLPVAEPWRNATLGNIGNRALSEGRGNYLANLALYPGSCLTPLSMIDSHAACA